MILVFDLDDTLYEERTYVESGLRAVASFGEEKLGLEAEVSYNHMMEILAQEGRGAIFDRWLLHHGVHSKKLVRTCVWHYRHHHPRIALNQHARALLPELSKTYPLYLVTDGHKIAQHRKIEALQIEPLFRRLYITHRFGLANAKPSTYCFERIREKESCAWQDITYVGDNPAKDFVGLNEKGAGTIRVMTGSHRFAVARPGYDAKRNVAHLGELAELLTAAAIARR